MKESQKILGKILAEENIILTGATKNNLSNVDFSFPLNTITCVSGVSGSSGSVMLQPWDSVYPLQCALNYVSAGFYNRFHITL